MAAEDFRAQRRPPHEAPHPRGVVFTRSFQAVCPDVVYKRPLQASSTSAVYALKRPFQGRPREANACSMTFRFLSRSYTS
jgi:hypothetical protein